jgi:hypothetical protein
MADISLRVWGSVAVHMGANNPCMAVNLEATLPGTDHLLCRDTIYLHGQPDQIRAFANAILDGLPGAPERRVPGPEPLDSVEQCAEGPENNWEGLEEMVAPPEPVVQ